MNKTRNDMKNKAKKPFCDCHKADKNFDGNCYYSELYDYCEHCVSVDVSNANLIDAIRTNSDAENKMKKLGYIK